MEHLGNRAALQRAQPVTAPLVQALARAVRKNVCTPIGIGFSGGIDSTLLAQVCHREECTFMLYTVGFPGAKDILAAQTIADVMDWPLTIKVLTYEHMEPLLRNVMRVTGKRDPVSVSIGYVAASLASVAQEDVLLTGFGPEEPSSANVNITLGHHFGKEMRFPFLDPEIPRMMGEQRKDIFRQAAVALGIPREFAFRTPCAVPDGSGVDAAIAALAREQGVEKHAYLSRLSAL